MRVCPGDRVLYLASPGGQPRRGTVLETLPATEQGRNIVQVVIESDDGGRTSVDLMHVQKVGDDH